MFQQSDAIRDYVFPIASAQRTQHGVSVKNFLGTGFVIGNRGFAITAAHVIAESEGEKLIGIFANPAGGWFSFELIVRESHPAEDVAVVKLDGGPYKSFFRISNIREHSSCKYRLFGYPEDAACELVVCGRAVLRPDLIYNEGYVRRRIAGPIPNIRGNNFYELSEVAGQGSSGAPIFKFTAPIWDVIGVYVGERVNERATSVSYCVQEEAFRDWTPKCMGSTILAESQNVAVL